VAARARYCAGAQPEAEVAHERAANSDLTEAGSITLSRRELESLIDEAVRRDRSTRRNATGA
jgi:hypothetical protein